MRDTRRWVLLVVAALVIGGLVAFARGPDHRRGAQRVSAHSDRVPTAAVAAE